MVYGVSRYFQQYISYIVAVILLMKEIGVPGQTLSHNVETRFDLKTLVALIASV
jgi:hypothetical protein